MSSAIEVTRHRLLESSWQARLSEARRQTDELFAILTPDSLYNRPIPERHRIIFYIGHLEAFDWNLLRERLFGLKAFHLEFDNLFAFGIDPVDGGLPTDQPPDWPSIEQVRRYVAGVRTRIDDALSELDFSRPVFSRHVPVANSDASPHTLLNVAIEHRLMHAETLAYMFHQLEYSRKIPPSSALALAASFPASDLPASSALVSGMKMIDIPAGRATLGCLRSDREAFGWDNEYEAHTVDVPSFSIDNHKITNRQYLDFIEAGGYERREFWTDADWQWKTSNHIDCPVFWKRAESGRNYRTWNYQNMFREIPLPMDWPVYVSHAEASAYARWAGKSLPTEPQWHRAAYATRDGAERPYPWGNEPPDSQKGNFDFARWDPAPVGSFSQGASAFGVHEMLGNGWEWTSTRFHPFPGFKEFSFYPGYSANFFDGKHYVLKGGSARTAASMLRRSFRNWFQPHYQYVYAGFRCVSNEAQRR